MVHELVGARDEHVTLTDVGHEVQQRVEANDRAPTHELVEPPFRWRTSSATSAAKIRSSVGRGAKDDDGVGAAREVLEKGPHRGDADATGDEQRHFWRSRRCVEKAP